MPKKKNYILILGVDCQIHDVTVVNDTSPHYYDCKAGDKFRVIDFGTYLNGTRYAAVISLWYPGVRPVSGHIIYNALHKMEEV